MLAGTPDVLPVVVKWDTDTTLNKFKCPQTEQELTIEQPQGRGSI